MSVPATLATRGGGRFADSAVDAGTVVDAGTADALAGPPDAGVTVAVEPRAAPTAVGPPEPAGEVAQPASSNASDANVSAKIPRVVRTLISTAQCSGVGCEPPRESAPLVASTPRMRCRIVRVRALKICVIGVAFCLACGCQPAGAPSSSSLPPRDAQAASPEAKTSPPIDASPESSTASAEDGQRAPAATNIPLPIDGEWRSPEQSFELDRGRALAVGRSNDGDEVLREIVQVTAHRYRCLVAVHFDDQIEWIPCWLDHAGHRLKLTIPPHREGFEEASSTYQLVTASYADWFRAQTSSTSIVPNPAVTSSMTP